MSSKDNGDTLVRMMITTGIDSKLWYRSRNNVARYLLGLAHFMRNETLIKFINEGNYPNLRLSFEPYISHIGHLGIEQSLLAKKLNVSKQACYQTLKDIELAGYIYRETSQQDARAKQLMLTEQGRQLLADGLKNMQRLEKKLLNIIGDAALSELFISLKTLSKQLDIVELPVIEPTSESAHFCHYLFRFSDHINLMLLNDLQSKGHKKLKISHGHILSLIDSHGVAIDHLVKANNISKQSVSAIAKDLIKLGYVNRKQSETDARQFLLLLTKKGEQLINDAVKAIEEFEKQYQKLLGKAQFQSFYQQLKNLYDALKLEQDEVKLILSKNIDELSEQLIRQLGANKAKQLANQLLQQTTINAG